LGQELDSSRESNWPSLFSHCGRIIGGIYLVLRRNILGTDSMQFQETRVFNYWYM